MSTFLGFPRRRGPAGIRNHVLVVAAEIACNPWAAEVARRVRGAFAVTHKHGVGNVGPDRLVFRRLLEGVVVHPNVAGVVVVASGNEDWDPRPLVKRAKEHGRSAHLVSAETLRSAAKLLSKGKALAHRLAASAQRAERRPVALGDLRIGLNCAGTDTSSAQTSNAACAYAVDEIIRRRGTVLGSELPEMIGAGQEFLGRCASATVRRQLQEAIRSHEKRLSAMSRDITKAEFCPFNFKGGLSDLKVKTRISVAKLGTHPIRQVVAYGQRPTRKGLVIMDGPAFTDFVMAGYMGSGAHMMLNCCGSGPANLMPVAVGADRASPILPVLKIGGSSAYARQKENRIDFDAEPVAAGPDARETVGRQLLDLILKTASGKRTRTEKAQDIHLHFPTRFQQA